MAEELHQALQNILRAETKKIILGNAQKEAEYRKIEIAQKKSDYQISKYTEKQVFHENCTLAQVQAFCEKALEGDFRQANIWDDAFEHQVRISKKGACSVSRRRLQEAVKLSSEHNRKKNYKLQEGGVDSAACGHGHLYEGRTHRAVHAGQVPPDQQVY